MMDDHSCENIANNSSQLQPAQTLSSTAGFPNYLYTNSSVNINAETNRRQYPMMSPYAMFPVNQWAVNSSEGLNMPSNNIVPNATTCATPVSSCMNVTSNTGTNVSHLTPYMMNTQSNTTGMYGMMGNPYQIMTGQENVAMYPIKTVIPFSKGILYPPNPNAPPSSRHAKPPGCKTVFIGGLPEKITEEIIREAFNGCGEILTVRMNKKNFCHIRFSQEIYVEAALQLSGYRLKIENKDEPAFSGKLHVDYALAKDDQYEYECHMRAQNREHAEQLPIHPPTPPSIVPYSDQEVKVVTEKLGNEPTFKEAVQVLITWLSNGECNKKTAGNFYYMIQSTNHHVQRLMNDKAKYEEELNNARMMLRQKMFGISLQFTDIEKVFEAARLQKVWDHFTKAQRKSIELMMKQTLEIKKANWDELIDDRVEDEMDLSDDDNSSIKDQEKSEEFITLREQVDNLRNQLSAVQQEAEEIKKEREDKMNNLRNSFHFVCQKLIESQKEAKELDKLLPSTSEKENSELDKKHSATSHLNSASHCDSCSSAPDVGTYTARELRLISIIGAYLHVHRDAVSVDYIRSYLVQYDSISKEEITRLMKQFPTLFKEIDDGTPCKRWTYLGLRTKFAMLKIM